MKRYRNPFTISIYALIHPTTKDVRYVGQTNNPPKRFSEHCADANWIIDLQAQGLLPDMVILETCQKSNALERESHWIKVYLRDGAELANAVAMAPEWVRQRVLQLVRGKAISRAASTLGVTHAVVRRICTGMVVRRKSLTRVLQALGESVSTLELDQHVDAAWTRYRTHVTGCSECSRRKQSQCAIGAVLLANAGNLQRLKPSRIGVVMAAVAEVASC